MGFIHILTLALFSLNLVSAVKSAEPAVNTNNDIKVKATARFPNAEVFGIKLVNRHPTEALITVTNNEAVPVNVFALGGTLWTIGYTGKPESYPIRNLTTTVLRTEVPAGANQTFVYTFTTELNPADLILKLAAFVSDESEKLHTIQAYDETVSIVEAPVSFFDPQVIFLYLVLASGFVGTLYFIYSTWLSTLFPAATKRRSGGKGGERAKTSSKGSKKVDASTAVNVTGADGPAVTTGAAAYDESWIPAHHIQRPGAKRGGSATPGSVKTKSR